MFRRLATVVPRSVGTVVSPRVTPALSGVQTTQAPLRASLAPQRRGYHEKVLDHYNNPRNVGSMNRKDVDVGSGLVGAPACGDVMKLQIRVDKDTNTISDVKFKTFGCGSAIASSSYLTELVRGMTLEEAGKVTNVAIAKELCLPPVKLHCSMLAEDAIKSAISDYYTKNPNARTTDLGGTGAAMPDIKVEVEKTDSGAAASL
ncbi:iron sulfur cluster assembly protein [Aspergillus ambiguus]|uniref:putative iron-sulfur cofactor synthesis protein (Isu1) n=1 Tax=Aspergillus ambiguus TaxID=176160 RepID=UPI003CCD4A24